MKDALTTTMTTLPAELLRSLIWDRGKELSAHAQFNGWKTPAEVLDEQLRSLHQAGVATTS